MPDFDGVQGSLFFFGFRLNAYFIMGMNGYNYSCVYEKKQCTKVFPVIIHKLQNQFLILLIFCSNFSGMNMISCCNN